MAMHISRSDPIGDQTFDHLKIWKSNIVDYNHKTHVLDFTGDWQI